MKTIILEIPQTELVIKLSGYCSLVYSKSEESLLIVHEKGSKVSMQIWIWLKNHCLTVSGKVGQTWLSIHLPEIHSQQMISSVSTYLQAGKSKYELHRSNMYKKAIKYMEAKVI